MAGKDELDKNNVYESNSPRNLTASFVCVPFQDALCDALLGCGATSCSIEDANLGQEGEEEVTTLYGTERLIDLKSSWEESCLSLSGLGHDESFRIELDPMVKWTDGESD